MKRGRTRSSQGIALAPAPAPAPAPVSVSVEAGSDSGFCVDTSKGADTRAGAGLTPKPRKTARCEATPGGVVPRVATPDFLDHVALCAIAAEVHTVTDLDRVKAWGRTLLAHERYVRRVRNAVYARATALMNSASQKRALVAFAESVATMKVGTALAFLGDALVAAVAPGCPLHRGLALYKLPVLVRRAAFVVNYDSDGDRSIGAFSSEYDEVVVVEPLPSRAKPWALAIKAAVLAFFRCTYMQTIYDHSKSEVGLDYEDRHGWATFSVNVNVVVRERGVADSA